MPKNSKENIEKRRAAMLSFVEKQPGIKVAQLAKGLEFSEMTIRRDLASLERMNFLTVASGGAIFLNDTIKLDEDLSKRKSWNSNEKIAIAKCAISLIKKGDTIGLDASTSALEISNLILNNMNVKVITNNLLVPVVLSQNEVFDVKVTGGDVRARALSLVGENAVKGILRHEYDKVFISSNAVHPNFGLMDSDLDEANTKIAFVKKTKKVVVLADNSKMGKQALQKCCGLAQIDILITDAGTEAEIIKQFTKKGVRVIVAE